MYTKQFNRQQRRVNRRLNKTGIQLVIDATKRKSMWRNRYMVEGLCKEETNSLRDILSDKTLRRRYISKLLTRTR